jgi:hypothetical protein
MARPDQGEPLLEPAINLPRGPNRIIEPPVVDRCVVRWAPSRLAGYEIPRAAAPADLGQLFGEVLVAQIGPRPPAALARASRVRSTSGSTP